MHLGCHTHTHAVVGHLCVSVRRMYGVYGGAQSPHTLAHTPFFFQPGVSPITTLLLVLGLSFCALPEIKKGSWLPEIRGARARCSEICQHQATNGRIRTGGFDLVPCPTSLGSIVRAPGAATYITEVREAASVRACAGAGGGSISLSLIPWLLCESMPK